MGFFYFTIMAKEIQLTRGKIAIVDDDMYDYLMQWKWYAHSLSGKFYSTRCIRIGGKKITILMHRIIMNTKKGLVVDHINGLTLDNRKVNLRICTHGENIRNQKLSISNKSGYKGVYFNKRDSNWRARIQLNNKEIHIGCYINIKDAARAYNEAAVKYHGEFANLNKID